MTTNVRTLLKRPSLLTTRLAPLSVTTTHPLAALVLPTQYYDGNAVSVHPAQKVNCCRRRSSSTTHAYTRVLGEEEGVGGAPRRGAWCRDDVFFP